MTAAPKGEKKADAENTDPVANAALDAQGQPITDNDQAGTTPGAREEAEPLPAVPGPNEPVQAGVIETTVIAKDDELSDPSGRKTEQKKTTRAPRKSDPFKKEIEHDKLPVAVAIGQVTGSVESHAGRAVLSLSLRGWVGEAPFKILAEDAHEVEEVLNELRSQLG